MVDDVPLAIIVEGVQRVFPVALRIFADPRRTVSAADTAHGVEGHLSGSTGEVSCCRMPDMDPQKVLLWMIEPGSGVICCSESEPSVN